ncbi:MAG: CatA-like O-acetyltransferase [Myxococcota bacterium]
MPFFAVYLYACMRAINAVPNLRTRVLEDGRVVEFDAIHASATILRADSTFGFAFIEYEDTLETFVEGFRVNKKHAQETKDPLDAPPRRDCIHCSALPWIDFTAHREPYSGTSDSVPKLAFGKVAETNGRLEMSVGFTVDHALVDGVHVGLFAERFQSELNAP